MSSLPFSPPPPSRPTSPRHAATAIQHPAHAGVSRTHRPYQHRRSVSSSSFSHSGSRAGSPPLTLPAMQSMPVASSSTANPRISQFLTTVLGSPFLVATPDLDLDLVDGAPQTVPHAETVTRPSSPAPTADFSIIDFDPDYEEDLRQRHSYRYVYGQGQGRHTSGRHGRSISTGMTAATFGRRTLHSSTPGMGFGVSSNSSTPLKSIFPKIWDALSSPARSFTPGPPASSISSGSHFPSSPSRHGTYGYSSGKGKNAVRHAVDCTFSPSAQFIDYSKLPPLDGEEGELVAIDDEACFIDVRAVTGIDILSLLPPELSLYILILLCASSCSSPPSPSLSSSTSSIITSQSQRHPIASIALQNQIQEAAHDSLQTILACSAVSRKWRVLANDNAVWRALFLNRWSVDLRRARKSELEMCARANDGTLPPNGIYGHDGPLSQHYLPSSRSLCTEGMTLSIPASPSPGASPSQNTSGSMRMKMALRKKKVMGLLNPSSSSSPSFSTPISFIAPSPSFPSSLSSRNLRTPPPFSPSVLSTVHLATADLPSRRVSLLPVSHAPLRLDWRYLYCERMELEKRWNGTATDIPMLPRQPFGSLPVQGDSTVLNMVTPQSHTQNHEAVPRQHQLPIQPAPDAGSEPWEPKVMRISGHSDSVYCLEFDSTRIITGSRDRTIKAWSLKTGRLLGTFWGAHRGSVLCLKFEGDWEEDWEDGKDVHVVNGDIMPGMTEESGFGCPLVNAAKTEGGVKRKGFMVSGSSDCSVCVWDLTLGDPIVTDAADGEDSEEREVKAEIKAVLKGHAGGVLDLRIDDRWIVSCSKDAVIRVWDRRTLTLYRTLRGHEGPVNAVGLQSGKIVSASGDGKMILWDIQRGERMRTFEGHDRGLACIEFKDDLIVSGSNDCKIKLWSASTGECLRTLVGHDALVRALSFDPRSGRLVSASYDKTVKVWDLSSGKMVREFKNTHTSHIFDVKFDVARIVSTSHDQKIVVVDFSHRLNAASVFV